MSVEYFVFASMHCKWFKKNPTKINKLLLTIYWWFQKQSNIDLTLFFILFIRTNKHCQLTLLKSKLNISCKSIYLLTTYVNKYPKEDFMRRSDKKSSGSLLIRIFSDLICTPSCASAVRFINIDDVWSFL